MTKRKFLTFAFLLVTLALAAQRTTHVDGTVVSTREARPIEMATVRLLQLPDSTLAAGAVTDSLGRFALTVPQSGRFALKVSYIGLPSLVKPIDLTTAGDSLHLDAIALEGEDIALRAAVVKAALARVEQKEDTTVFNAGAFRTAEGSTLEALVKQLPGAEIADDGTIKINGKTVKEFLINGKDFFKGDTKVAMKNLPTDIISKLKTYDKKSDYAEQTGIDDGEETFVLDISTKRELNQSFISNIDLGGGWDYADRGLYAGRLFATRFTDRTRYTVFANHNNVGDRGFGGPRGFNNNTGLTTSSMVGTDFSWSNNKKRFSPQYFEAGGSVLYFRSDNATESTTASETFLNSGTGKSSFANTHAWNTNLDQRIFSRFNLQWSPDSLTSLSFRPHFTWSRTNTTGSSRTATFDADPFERYDVDTTDEVLERAFRNTPSGGVVTTTDDFLANLTRRDQRGRSTSTSADGHLEMTRRLGGRKGRNISLQAEGSYSNSTSFSYSKADIYARTTPAGTSPALLTDNGTHQFADNDSKAWSYRLGAGYVEPLFGKLYGEVRYHFEHKFTDGNRSLYNLHDLQAYPTLAAFMAAHPAYGVVNNVYLPGADKLTPWMDAAQLLSTLNATDVQAAVRDAQNSQYATYHYNTHNAQLRLRFNTEKINLSAGISFTPERTHLDYERPIVGRMDTVRNVFNLSPQVRFRYNISKTDRLDIFYRGSSSQPSMTQLLNVVDSSDPLNIVGGNPGLKPAWNDMLHAFYNAYNAERQQGTMAYANFNHTRNAVSTLMVYDAATGRRFTRPENLSGNWNAAAGLTFNTPLDKQKVFTLATSTNAAFTRSVGFVSSSSSTAFSGIPTLEQLNALFASVAAEKSVSRVLTLGENIDLAYRRSLWDVALNGRVNYQHSRASLQAGTNLDTWSFAYGATANLNLPFGLSLSTDIRMQSRRGFSASSMNTNELLWNAQLSQSFLRDRSLTLSLRFYDILSQQSDISRTVNAMMRADTWSNSLYAYAMLHVIYKLNIFGGNAKTENPGNRPGPDPRGPMMPPPGGGHRGFGGPGHF